MPSINTSNDISMLKLSKLTINVHRIFLEYWLGRPRWWIFLKGGKGQGGESKGGMLLC